MSHSTQDANSQTADRELSHEAILVRRVLWAILIIATLWRVWALAGAWFWQDDIIHIYQASTMSLSEFVPMSWNGHLEPGSWLIYWLMTDSAPQAWGPAFVIACCIQLVTNLALMAVLRALFGLRWGVVVPYAVAVLMTASLTPLLWFATALELNMTLMWLSVGLYCFVRLEQSKRAVYVVGIVGCFIAALLFQERALAIPVFLFGCGWLLLSSGPWWASFKATLLRQAALWVSLVVVAGIYLLAFYLPSSGYKDQVTEAASIGDAVSAAFIAVFDTLVPSLVGGPWSEPIDNGTLGGLPPLGLQMAACIVIGAAVCVAWYRRPHSSRRAVVFVFLLLLAELIPLILTRLDFISTIVARDPRYIVIAALACGIALPFMFMAPKTKTGELGPDYERAKAVDWRFLGRVPPAVVAGVGVLALVISAWPTYVFVGTSAHDREVRGWIETARASVVESPSSIVADGPVPNTVVSEFFVNYDRTRTPLAVGPNQPRFNEFTTDAKVFDGLGKLKPADVIDVKGSAKGPMKDCGFRISTTPTDIDIKASESKRGQIMRLPYYTSFRALVTVKMGNLTQQGFIEPGLGNFFTFPQGDVDGITVTVAQPQNAVVCVGEIQVGTPWPAS